MVEKFLEQTTFTSQEDFIKNLKIKIPENFNFGYDIVDAWAAEEFHSLIIQCHHTMWKRRIKKRLSPGFKINSFPFILSNIHPSITKLNSCPSCELK